MRGAGPADGHLEEGASALRAGKLLPPRTAGRPMGVSVTPALESGQKRPPLLGEWAVPSRVGSSQPCALPPALPEGLQDSQERPLVLCLQRGDFELAFLLLTEGADPRGISLTEGDTPLHAALHIFLDVEGRLLFLSSPSLGKEAGC